MATQSITLKYCAKRILEPAFGKAPVELGQDDLRYVRALSRAETHDGAQAEIKRLLAVLEHGGTVRVEIPSPDLDAALEEFNRCPRFIESIKPSNN